MGIRFVPYVDVRGEHRTRIVDTNNGQIMWDAGQGYNEPEDRDHGIHRLIDDIKNGDYDIDNER